MSTPKPMTLASRLASKCHKKCLSAAWDAYDDPNTNGGRAWMEYTFDIPSATQGAFFSLTTLVMRFHVERHNKYDKVLDWLAVVRAPLISRDTLDSDATVATLDRPETLEEAQAWAKVVAALYEAENPPVLRYY